MTVEQTTAPPVAASEPELIPIKVACKRVPCSMPTMYALIRAGRVKAYKIGRSTLIDPVSLRDGVRAVPLTLPSKIAPTERSAQRVKPAQPAKHRRAKSNAKPPARRARAVRAAASA